VAEELEKDDIAGQAAQRSAHRGEPEQARVDAGGLQDRATPDGGVEEDPHPSRRALRIEETISFSLGRRFRAARSPSRATAG